MAQTTKRALGMSLRKLLLQKPLNKITINDITEDCGVNRMTFYYHFKDIYDLIDWILTEDANKYLENGVNRMTFYYHFKDIYDLIDWILAEDANKYLENGVNRETWRETLIDILNQIQENRALVLNVYRSVSREQIEQYLYQLLDPSLREFSARESQGMTIRDGDRQFVIDFYKYALVGILLEWIRKDMKDDPALIAERLDTMLRGNMRQAMSRLRVDGAPSAAFRLD